jgi:hypothetical protein
MRTCLILAFWISQALAFGQPRTSEPLIDEGFRDLYNLSFADAHKAFDEWGKLHPDDPRTPDFHAAAYLFTEFERLNILQSEFFTNDNNFLFPKKLSVDAAVQKHLLTEFDRAKRMADAQLIRSPNDENALMAEVLRSGLYANYLALLVKQETAALREIKQGKEFADRLLRVHPDAYDAHLASGVENYLLSQKIAPVRWLLRLGGAETDRAKGLADLRIVASKGHYLRPYAELLLAVAALRAENKAEARRILTDLAQRFPRNRLYREELKKIPA